MEIDRGLVIVCGILMLVILGNVGLILSFRDPSNRKVIKNLQDALSGLANPWREEDHKLAQLRETVEQLKEVELDEESTEQ
jgi:hypothetical protein